MKASDLKPKVEELERIVREIDTTLAMHLAPEKPRIGFDSRYDWQRPALPLLRKVVAALESEENENENLATQP